MESQKKRLETAPGIKRVRVGYLSADDETQIKAHLWTSESNQTSPKAIVQITHGIQEDAQSYHDLANYLASQGFVVCAQDLLGHGESLSNSGKSECTAMLQDKNILVEDAHELRKLVASRFSQQTPYIMLGSSFGSLVVRAYSTQYGNDLTAMILCGSIQEPKLRLWGNYILSNFLVKKKGKDHRSAFLDKRWRGIFASKQNNTTISYDGSSEDVQGSDSRMSETCKNEVDGNESPCEAALPAGVYLNIAALSKELASSSHLRSVPKTPALLFVSGALDPAIGTKGSLLQKAVNALKQEGLESVDFALYEDVGHEILQGSTREEVYSDIAEWIDRQIIKE